MKSTKYKIAFTGGFGASDAGDDAMLSTVLLNFKKIIPNSQFLILSEDPQYSIKHKRGNQAKVNYSITHYLLPKRQHLSNNKIFKIFVIRKFYILLNFLFNGFILLINAKRIKNNKKTFFLNDEGGKYYIF